MHVDCVVVIPAESWPRCMSVIPPLFVSLLHLPWCSLDNSWKTHHTNGETTWHESCCAVSSAAPTQVGFFPLNPPIFVSHA